jgi:hypothetical protein
MKVRKFIQSHYGKMIISVILGLGLSTLFRKSCGNKKCMNFVGPSLDKLKGQVYEYDRKCYTFSPNPVKCSSKKKTVQFA